MCALHSEDFESVMNMVSPQDVTKVQAATVATECFQVRWRQERRCGNPDCTGRLDQNCDNMGLQLEIPDDSVTILELLERHFATEIVKGFKCGKCHVRGTCEIRKPVTHWPPRLFLHTKRFRKDNDGHLRKIQEYVFFSEQLVSESLGCTYDLEAVIVHFGCEIGGGHYVCYVVDSGGRWMLLNDSAPPVVVSFDDVRRVHAYCLLYRLRGSV